MRTILLCLLLLPSFAQAGTLLELGGTYLSDSTNTGSTKTTTGYFYNLAVMFNLQKKIWGGWNYLGINQSATGTDETTFSTADTGPCIKWQFGRSEVFSLTGAFHILSKGTYKTGSSSSENWTGTSFWLQFGMMPELKEGLHLGVALNYYSATYTKKTINSTESADSNSKSWIFPSIALTKQW